MAEPDTPKPRKRRRLLRERDAYRHQGRIQMAGNMCWLSFFCIMVATFAGHKVPGLRTIFFIIAALAPIAGYFLHDLLDSYLGKTLRGLFWGDAKNIAPAHSPGDALAQRGRWEEAIDWFAQRAMEDPSDWRAQARLVELVASHGNDAERLAEERMRLMKWDGISPSLWVQTAFEHARSCEEEGRHNRAAHAYQSILWKFPDDESAADAERRLEELRSKGLA
jgi:tetratricopeptide (TPR) repeat protein